MYCTPLGSKGSIAAWGRAITCTATSSPARFAAAAPASTAERTAPISPAHEDGGVAAAGLFLSGERDMRCFQHRIRRLDRCHQSLCFDHAQSCHL